MSQWVVAFVAAVQCGRWRLLHRMAGFLVHRSPESLTPTSSVATAVRTVPFPFRPAVLLSLSQLLAKRGTMPALRHLLSMSTVPAWFSNAAPSSVVTERLVCLVFLIYLRCDPDKGGGGGEGGRGGEGETEDTTRTISTHTSVQLKWLSLCASVFA